MATIAPWLRPTDVLGSIQAGTQTGLEQNRIDSANAAMMLRAAMESQRLAQEGSLAQQHMHQQEMAAQGLKDYRSGLLAQKEDELSQREKAGESLAGFRTGQLDLRERELQDKEKGAGIPKTPSQIAAWYAQDPVMQREENEAMKKIQSGMPVMDVLNQHPTLIKYPPYSTRWAPLYREQINKQSGPGDDLRKLASERNLLQNTLDRNVDLPADTQSALTSRLKDIDTRIGSQGLPQAGPPADTGLPEAQPSATVQVFTDSSGKKFRYVGGADDPMSDKNPDSWETVEEGGQ